MKKTLALGGLIATLASGHSQTADYQVIPQLLDLNGRDRQTKYFTPGREYYLGVYLENAPYPASVPCIDHIQWKFENIEGGEITHAFTPSPHYLFSDYFVGRVVNTDTNQVTLEGGVRAIPQLGFQTNVCHRHEGLAGIYTFRVNSNANEIKITLTNVHAYSFTPTNLSQPRSIEVRTLQLRPIAQFDPQLKIERVSYHPWIPSMVLSNHVLLTTPTNTEGFFEILEESSDFRNWKPIALDDSSLFHIQPMTNSPAAFYRIRMKEFGSD